MANDKVRVTVVLEYDVNGEYNQSDYDDLSDQIIDLAEGSDLDMIDLNDGSRLTLSKIQIDSIEEM